MNIIEKLNIFKKEYKARTFDLREIKSAWAKAVNNKNNHPYKDAVYGNKIRGKIYSVHYLVYNLLRKMPAERGFEPVGQGFKEAQESLERAIKSPVYHIDYLGNSKWRDGNRLEDLLYPFDGTVTIEQLKELL
jgi:uncharacterized protein YabN with tetrapyrrole methylase and pyrophosphatase domain